jgi:hypothetical protein
MILIELALHGDNVTDAMITNQELAKNNTESTEIISAVSIGK